jgi:hypothetical protein
MATADPPVESELCYFTHAVGNTIYGGYYRILALDCIDVHAVGLVKTVSLDNRSPLTAACEALEQFLLITQRLGLPLRDVALPLLEPMAPHSMPV